MTENEIKKEIYMHLDGEYPKVKIVYGNSKIFCKKDSLFGQCLAYEIRETDMPAIRNFISKLNEIFM